MTDAEIKKAARDFAKKAGPIIKRLQKDRDDLRDLVSEYIDILETVNDGIESVNYGVDTISQLI